MAQDVRMSMSAHEPKSVYDNTKKDEKQSKIQKPSNIHPVRCQYATTTEYRCYSLTRELKSNVVANVVLHTVRTFPSN